MQDGVPTKKFYSSKHFYRFIRPDAVRISADINDDSLFVSAFKHEGQQTTTIQIINNSFSDKTLMLEGHQTKLSRKWNKYVTTSELNCELYSNVKAKNGIVIPAQSIVTLYDGQENIAPDYSGKEMIAVDLSEKGLPDFIGNNDPFPSKNRVATRTRWRCKSFKICKGIC
jgi:hypothetical protein